MSLDSSLVANIVCRCLNTLNQHCSMKTDYTEGLTWQESNDSDSDFHHNFLITVSQQPLRGTERNVTQSLSQQEDLGNCRFPIDSRGSFRRHANARFWPRFTTLSVDRNLGIGFGNIIQGTFTLRGSGPAEVQNLTVYFNGEQVHFVAGNTIAWQFHTGDYAPGSTNITLFGLDDSGGTYSATRDVFILSEAISTVVIGIIMTLVVVLVIVRYGPILRKKKTGSSS